MYTPWKHQWMTWDFKYTYFLTIDDQRITYYIIIIRYGKDHFCFLIISLLIQTNSLVELLLNWVQESACHRSVLLNTLLLYLLPVNKAKKKKKKVTYSLLVNLSSRFTDYKDELLENCGRNFMLNETFYSEQNKNA